MAENHTYDFSQVLGAQETLVSRGLAATPIDLTISGEVVKIENPGIGQYLIKYQSNTWQAFSLNPEIVYNTGEKVYILVPQGDFSGKKIIIGRSSAADNISYAEIQEMTNFFVPYGPNWLDETWYGQDHEQLGICAVPRADRMSVKNLEGANYTDYCFARWPYASNTENQAIWTDNKKTLPPKNHHYAEDRDPTSYPTPTQLEFADRMIKEMNTSLTWVGVKAKFRTSFLAEHTHGKYGIRVEYLVRNHRYEAPYTDAEGVMHPGRTDVPKYDIVTKEVSFESFSGNPYAYYNETEQIGYFEIPLNQIEGLYRVSLFQNGVNNGKTDEENRITDMEVDCMPTYTDDGNIVYRPANNIYDTNNIFATEIDIRYYIKKNLLDSKYLVWITADKGRFLYDGDSDGQGVSEVTLTAHLFYGNKDILNENDYNVYWFRECPDYDATNSSQSGRDDNGNKWKQYGGFGWAPILRPKEGFGSDDPIDLYVEGFMPTKVNEYGVFDPNGHTITPYTQTWNTLTIPKDQVPWRWLYQCVIVQKRNQEIKDDAGNVVESGVLDQNPFWRYEEPSGLDGFEVCRLGGKYDLWLSDVIVDGTRSFLEIREREAWDTDYVPPRMNPDWYGNWWVETPGRAPYAFAQQPDEKDPDQFRQIQYDANIYKGQVDISPYIDSEWQKFIVGCYDPKMLEVEGVNGVAANFGKNRTMCVGVLRKRLENGNGSGLHVSWDPNQYIFNYSADGKGKAFTSENDWTLRPTIHWDDGLTDKGIVRIYGPGGIDTTPLDKVEVYRGNEIGQGYTPNSVPTMLHDLYIETTGQAETPIIHFKVNDRWSDVNTGEEADNHFYLELESYTGQIYGPFDYEVVFTKDGGSGSNGTGWSVDISPCNPDIVNAGTSKERVKFSQKYNYAMPVVVVPTTSNKTGWKTKPKDAGNVKEAKHPVYIRPFIQKGGEGQGARVDGTDITKENSLFTEFYQFSPSQGYWAEYFWDVRIKGTDSDYQYKSFVKLCCPGDAQEVHDSATKDGIHNPYTWGNTAGIWGSKPRGWSDEVTDWPAIPGMCAYTHSEDGNFGAVEIQWNELMDKAVDFNFADFVVSVEIVIYRNCFNEATGKIEARSAKRQLVTELYAYYPLDIFFDNGFSDEHGEFNPQYVALNWPRVIEYSTVGADPQYESSPYGLEFYYGPNAKNLSKHNYEWNPAYNITPDIQDIIVTDGPEVEYFEHAENAEYQLKTKKYGDPVTREFSDASGNKITHKYWQIQVYQPKGGINPVNGLIGALSTWFQEEAGEKSLSVFGNSVYLRAQVFTLNRFGNQAINAWDGQSISLDNENGAILAPTVVAGYKSPAGNDFSGCVMGIDKQITKQWYKNAGGSLDDWDERQVNYCETAGTFEEQNKYMAGLYGYQKGVCSFGLMENGVAFFGRANGGAQIILDGSNGVIMGGGNGFATTGGISTPMWNSMRLNLVDLSHNRNHQFVTSGAQREAEKTGDVDGTHPVTSVYIPTGHNEDGKNNKSQELRLDYETYFRNPRKTSFSKFYDSDDLDRLHMPYWYQYTWEHATIKRSGELPYYLNYEDAVGGMFEQTTKQRWEDLPKFDPRVNADFTNGEMKVDYWKGTVFDYAEDTNVDDSQYAQQRSSFSAGRASTTPAIEIGQHVEGLVPGILPWGTAEWLWSEFYIPGNRNFMVTYDGTLWAMNGVFMGNVIGSNFVGGRIQGCEIGIGTGWGDDGYDYEGISNLDNWKALLGPTAFQQNAQGVNNGSISRDEAIPRFWVDQFGNMSASTANIRGGSIHIGSFHIVGPDDVDKYGRPIKTDNYGRLIQFGESDFVGLVHCYGNLGIGPNLNDDKDNGGSNFGHFTQTKGQVAMGIAVPKTNLTQVHKWLTNEMGMEQNGWHSPMWGNRAKYRSGSGKLPGTTGSLEQAAFFGIDSAGELPKEDNTDFYAGHMWPMAFNYNSDSELAGKMTGMVPGWFTTMDLFKGAKGFVPNGHADQMAGSAAPTDSDKLEEGGSNYFRVSPFAVESRFNYIRVNWMNEDEIDLPSYTSYAGYLGLTERAGDGGKGTADSWGIGIQSFETHPIMIHSSAETCVRSFGWIELCSNYTKGDSPTVINAGDPSDPLFYSTSKAQAWRTRLVVGEYLGDTFDKKEPDNCKGLISGISTNKGSIEFIVTNQERAQNRTANDIPKKMHDMCLAGLTLNGGNASGPEPGSWLWNSVDDVHIVQGKQDANAASQELYLSKDGKVGISGSKEVFLTVGKSAHDNPEGKPGISIKENETVIGTPSGQIKMDSKITFEGSYANENNQINIYARFA